MPNPTKEQLKEKLRDEKSKNAELTTTNQTLQKKLEELNSRTTAPKTKKRPMSLHGGVAEDMLD